MATTPTPTPVFNPRLVVGIIVAGIAGFAALMLLLAFGDRIGSSRSGRANALSVSAVGYKGLVDLAAGMGIDTFFVRNNAQLEGLVVVAIEPQSRPETLRQLLEARTSASMPTLVILPKWVTMPDPNHAGWVEAVFPGASSPAVAAIEEPIDIRPAAAPGGRAHTATGTGALAGLTFPVPARYQSVQGKQLTHLLTAPDGGALIAQLGNRPLYLLADPDLVANHALRDPARARAAIELLTRLNLHGIESPIGFDLTVNGYGSGEGRSLLRTAFEPPFLAMTLALFVAALLALLHGAFRFGPTRREQRAIAFGKTALVENSAGLIRLANRESRLGPAYADVLRHDLARAASAPGHLQGEALDAYLNRLAREGPSFSELAADVAAASNKTTLMTAVRRLWDWRKTVLP